MESIVFKLLQDFENGKMTRRQLVQSLALAATGASTAAASVAPVPAANGFQTVALDHISYQVRDYRRTRDFYADLMGMTVSGDNGSSQCQLRFGAESSLIARNHRQREGEPVDPDPKPTVDHISYRIGEWDTDGVKAELERRGLTPRLDTGGGDNYASFHVEDPDGYDLQISGEVTPGDSLYKDK